VTLGGVNGGERWPPEDAGAIVDYLTALMGAKKSAFRRVGTIGRLPARGQARYTGMHDIANPGGTVREVRSFISPCHRIGGGSVTGHPTSPRDPASAQEPIVLVVDDDDGMRRALSNLFESVGLKVQAFGSAAEMLQSKLPDAPSCLVLDIRLPGLGGLDFQIELAKANIHIPIIFVTGHGDIPMTVRAMKGGAIDFLTKPFRDQDILDSVAMAIERDRNRREEDKTVSELRAHFETLTQREREVLALVTAGLMNKQIAGEIGLAEITVKIHRGHVMKKMGARSLADLVRMVEAMGINRAKP
jgi:FixJ family two-component response regulator